MKPSLTKPNKQFPIRNKPKGLDFKDAATGTPCVYVNDSLDSDYRKVFFFHPTQKTWVLGKRLTKQVGELMEKAIKKLSPQVPQLKDIASLSFDERVQAILQTFQDNPALDRIGLVVNASEAEEYAAMFEKHQELFSVESRTFAINSPTITYKLVRKTLSVSPPDPEILP